MAKEEIADRRQSTIREKEAAKEVGRKLSTRSISDRNCVWIASIASKEGHPGEGVQPPPLTTGEIMPEMMEAGQRPKRSEVAKSAKEEGEAAEPVASTEAGEYRLIPVF